MKSVERNDAGCETWRQSDFVGPERGWFRKSRLNKLLYTPAKRDLERIFRLMGLQNLETVLIGEDALFGTDQYGVIILR